MTDDCTTVELPQNEVVIYDREQPDAWIQSDFYVEVQ